MQMYSSVSTKDPAAVEVEVQAACLSMFPKADPLFVPRVFGWAIECFTGHYRDYQAVDALYHDFEHTLQGTLCFARLLHARQRTGAQPALTQRMFQLGILAILLHDTGYLKKRDDTEGTGAKYTLTHVARSADFAAELLAFKGFSPEEILSVQNMIRCTGVNTRPGEIAFQSELEKITGHALATADLLGQLAADDYVDKLPILYEEFAEAARFSAERGQHLASFASVGDLMRKTPEFWEGFVKKRLEREFDGVYRFLNQPYPNGANYYLRKIEANIGLLRERLTVHADC
jgi:hypothetical protein